MWEPIVEGDDAVRVWSAIDAIAEALAELDAPAADLAVFWSYLAAVRDDELTHTRAARALENFAAALARGFSSLALFEGLAGAGWAAAHVASDAEDLLVVVDARLIAALTAGWRGPFDLVDGVAGFGVYFLEREGAAATRGLELVVDYFAAHAEHTADGATWRTRVEHGPLESRARWPNGYYDCGVAHGVPGVIRMLSRIAARDDATPRARELRDAALSWLLAQRRDGRFPMLVTAEERLPARTAWCYGDAAISVALHGLIEAPPWISRTPESTGVRDDGLCHGAAGLAHLALRLYQATRDAAYRDAARAWIRQLLGYQRPGQGVGGFGHEPEGARRAAIVSGSAGVGLALLAAVSDVEPAWDRQLLCDL